MYVSAPKMVRNTATFLCSSSFEIKFDHSYHHILYQNVRSNQMYLTPYLMLTFFLVVIIVQIILSITVCSLYPLQRLMFYLRHHFLRKHKLSYNVYGFSSILLLRSLQRVYPFVFPSPSAERVHWMSYTIILYIFDFSVWGYIETRACDCQYPKIGDLKAAITNQWAEMSESYVKALYSTLRPRIEAVIAADGDYID